MAGDGWVVDIVWHAMILLGNALADLWSSWTMEILLGASFIMQLVLTFFAGFRWRGASDSLRLVIWLFYVAMTALGYLSVSGASGERRLVAFWAPFFLLHLGGPDSITAYQLEDNELSGRYVLELVLQVVEAVYVVYKSISGSWALVPAAWLMLLVGVAKYVEKTLALHRANLANVRGSLESQQRRRRLRTKGASHRHRPNNPAGFHGDGNDDLIMRAHYLFYICKHAIVDSSVETESDTSDAAHTKEILFQLDWKKLCKVMEMELSLMYDFLYTKAAVIHTWHGYCIRALSPLVTATALLLVEFSNNAARRHKQSDVVITRALLVATFLLETASLLRALGSSWTGFLLHHKLPQGWIRHEAFCASRWSQFHRSVAYLGKLANVHAHRSWSGKMGQLNMLQLITREQTAKGQEFVGNAERYAETLVIPQEVKELVFKRVKEKVVAFRAMLKQDADATDGAGAPLEFVKIAAQLRARRGQQVLNKYELLDLRWSLGDELQLGILIWHIATNIYLLKSGKSQAQKGSRVAEYVKAITTLSNYMMYLLAVRPDMLPGLVTRKLLELTCEDLAQFWSKHGAIATDLQSSSSSFCNLRKLFKLHNHRPTSSGNLKQQEGLANILYNDLDSGAAVSPYLFGGLKLAKKLIRREREGKLKVDVLQLILEVWVDMLFYASYRCSKESHAKQLSHGGELTTIVWLMAEHVGLFVARKTSKADWKARKRANMHYV